MKAIAVSDLSLILSFALVLVSVAISWKEKLGLTRNNPPFSSAIDNGFPDVSRMKRDPLAVAILAICA